MRAHGEEREVGARSAFGVSVEQVIGPDVVLVDAALDEPHAENASIEVEILLRRSGDSGDVMRPLTPMVLPIEELAN